MRTSSPERPMVEKPDTEKVAVEKPEADASRRRRRGPREPRRGIRRFLEVLVIIAVVVSLDLLAGFALSGGSIAGMVLNDWRATAGQPIDTIVTGSSIAERSFDPRLLDATVGSDSFVFATFGQALDDSYAAVEESLATHRVKRVILGVDYETFSDQYPSAHVAFTVAKMRGEPFPQQVGDYLRLVTNRTFFTNANSISALFPWAYAHVRITPGSILENVKSRLRGESDVEAVGRQDPNWQYVGRGYGNYPTVYDFGETRVLDPSKQSGAQPEIDRASLNEIAEICTLCRDRGVEVYVVVVPRMTNSLLEYGPDYPRQMSELKAVVDACGGRFLDFTMAKRSVYNPADSDFSDHEHLNGVGAERFSKAFSTLLNQMEKGVDVSGDFYTYANWTEYLQSLNGIYAVSVKVTDEEGVRRATSRCITGEGVQPEFRFELLSDDGSTRTLRGWGTDPTVELPEDFVGKLVVYIRAVGSQTDYDRYCVVDVGR